MSLKMSLNWFRAHPEATHRGRLSSLQSIRSISPHLQKGEFGKRFCYYACMEIPIDKAKEIECRQVSETK